MGHIVNAGLKQWNGYRGLWKIHVAYRHTHFHATPLTAVPGAMPGFDDAGTRQTLNALEVSQQSDRVWPRSPWNQYPNDHGAVQRRFRNRHFIINVILRISATHRIRALCEQWP